MGILDRFIGRRVDSLLQSRFQNLQQLGNDIGIDGGEETHDATPDTEVSQTITRKDLRNMAEDPTVAGALNLMLMGALSSLSYEGEKKAVALVERIFDAYPGSPLQSFHTVFEEGLKTGRAYTELVRGAIPGGYLGLFDMVTVPEEDIRAKWTAYGQIEKVSQQTLRGETNLDMERLAFYAHRPSPTAPRGKSAFIPGVIPWRRKIRAMKTWHVFLRRRAGLLVAKIPDSQWQDDSKRSAARAAMKKIDGTAFGVLHEKHVLDLLETSGAPGAVYLDAVKYLDKQLLVALLCQELATAEGMMSGSRATAEAHGDVMWHWLQHLGVVFAETYIREQVVRPMMKWNGYSRLPTPQAVVAKSELAGKDLADMMTGLVEKNVIPWTPEASARLLERLGCGAFVEDVEAAPLESVGDAPAGKPPEDPGAAPAGQEKPETAMQQPERMRLMLAKRSKARSQAKREGKEMKKRAQLAAEGLSSVWNENLSTVSDRILSGVFSKKNLYETGMPNPDRIGAMRDAIEKGVTYPARALRKELQGHVEAQYKASSEAMKALLPTALETVPPAKLVATERQIFAILGSDIQLRLSEEFAGVSRSIYYEIRSGILAGEGPREIAPRVRNILQSTTFADPSRASTITLTEMSTALNEARWQTAAPLHDPLGTTPGSIIGYEYVIVDDADTTDICQERDGRFFRVDDPGLGANTPPLHYNCRSMLVPVFAEEANLVDFERTADMKESPMQGFGRSA